MAKIEEKHNGMLIIACPFCNEYEDVSNIISIDKDEKSGEVTGVLVDFFCQKRDATMKFFINFERSRNVGVRYRMID